MYIFGAIKNRLFATFCLTQASNTVTIGLSRPKTVREHVHVYIRYRHEVTCLYCREYIQDLLAANSDEM